MNTLNKVLFIGRTGQDPVIRYMDNNSKVARFSVATQEVYKDRNGEKKENTYWHDIVVFGPSVDFVEKYVKKGSQLFIEGRLRERKYTDKQGAEKVAVETVASNIQLLGTRDDRQENSRSAFVPDPKPQPRQQRPVQGPAPQPVIDDIPEDTDGLPF